MLFGHIIRELEPLLYGCEQTFVAEFVVSFAYRKLNAGEILQTPNTEIEEIYVIWEG